MNEANKRSAGGILGAAAISVLALALAAVVLTINHHDATEQRHEFRAAVVLLAHANCAEVDVIRRVTLSRTKDPVQRAATILFLNQLEKPISDALESLDAERCQP